MTCDTWAKMGEKSIIHDSLFHLAALRDCLLLLLSTGTWSSIRPEACCQVPTWPHKFKANPLQGETPLVEHSICPSLYNDENGERGRAQEPLNFRNMSGNHLALQAEKSITSLSIWPHFIKRKPKKRKNKLFGKKYYKCFFFFTIIKHKVFKNIINRTYFYIFKYA